jgi:ribosome-associated protein
MIKEEAKVETAVGAIDVLIDEEIFEDVRTAVQAAEEKKAQDLVVLQIAEITSFTDYFIICSGSSTRQVQAIADAITEQLKKRGVRPMNTEGYANAEWVLIDFGTFVAHIFTETSRRFYDLERLWRDAKKVSVA